MNLYHGTNIDFREIDLKKSRIAKDFGQGFYLSENYQQAYEMAIHKTKQEGGVPIVQSYFFDEKLFDAPKELKILKFEGYTEKWVRFIIQNRDNKTSVPTHNYDIVVGPIADDTVGLQLFQYRKHYINIENLIENLKFKKLTMQYFFGTAKAIENLKRI